MRKCVKKGLTVLTCAAMCAAFPMTTLAEAGDSPFVSNDNTLENQVAQWKQDSVGWWYQNVDGTYPRNQWQFINGSWYHFNSRGYMETGWFQYGGNWYYLKPDGRMTADQWEQVSGNWYHFDRNGYMETGWLQLGNTWYYLKSDGRMTVNQWEQIYGKWYHFDSNGAMQTGWYQSGNTWYYLKSSGAMAVNEWVERDRYYVDNNGIYIPGKVKTYSDRVYTIDLGNGKTTTVKGHIDVQKESQIFDMLNQYRKEQGLEEVTEGSEAMQNAVDIRAEEIVYSFSHTRPNGLSPFSFSREFDS